MNVTKERNTTRTVLPENSMGNWESQTTHMPDRNKNRAKNPLPYTRFGSRR